MGVLFEGVNWLAVGVSTIICFMLGALWYSPMMFGTKWAEGVKVDIGPETRQPVAALVTQFIGTLLLAWLIGLTHYFGVYPLMVLIVATIFFLLVAANLFGEHSLYATLTEAGFVPAMTVIMVICNFVL